MPKKPGRHFWRNANRHLEANKVEIAIEIGVKRIAITVLFDFDSDPDIDFDEFSQDENPFR